MTRQDLITIYPCLADLPELLAQRPDQVLGQVVEVPTGQAVFNENSPCMGFPLVLEGEIKVAKHAADGRQLELYRVVPGEICLISSASLFRGQLLGASGVTTRASRLLLIAPPQFEQWLASPGFRAEVLSLFAERMADLTALVEAVAFQKLDQRLAAVLLGHGSDLCLTHQNLADQLGTVREIVTRLLRRFEREAWVVLAREHIHIVDSQALRHLAQGG